MQAEHVDIAQFLSDHAPFDDLPEEAVNKLASQVEIAYFRAGTEILNYGEDIADLFVIRTGAVEIYRRDGDLYNRLTIGGIFGQMGLLMNRKVRFPAKALEDTLVYCINVELFNRYCDEYETFADFFEADGNVRLHQAIVEQADSNDLTTAKVKSLLHRDVVTVAKDASVQMVAQLMTQESVSSVLVTDADKPISDDPDDDDGQVPCQIDGGLGTGKIARQSNAVAYGRHFIRRGPANIFFSRSYGYSRPCIQQALGNHASKPLSAAGDQRSFPRKIEQRFEIV